MSVMRREANRATRRESSSAQKRSLASCTSSQRAFSPWGWEIHRNSTSGKVKDRRPASCKGRENSQHTASERRMASPEAPSNDTLAAQQLAKETDLLHAARKAPVPGYMGYFPKDWEDDQGRVQPPYGKCKYTSTGYVHIGDTPRADNDRVSTVFGYRKCKPPQFSETKSQKLSKQHSKKNRTAHQGAVTSLGAKAANSSKSIQDPLIINMLEDHCRQIRCPGVVESSWEVYKAGQHGAQLNGAGQRMVPQLLTSSSMAANKSIAASTWVAHDVSAATKSKPLVNPYVASFKSSVPMPFTPAWRGCEMRCNTKETFGNGTRPRNMSICQCTRCTYVHVCH